MIEAQQGDLLEFTWEYRRNDVPSRPLMDPDDVFFNVQPGTNPALGVITYIGSSSPAVNTIWRLTQGRYRTWVDSTPAAGVYTPKAWSTGGGQAAVPPVPINVLASPF